MSEFGEGMERVERVFRDYESLDQKFKVKGTVYTTQYSQVYNERTVEMKGSLEMLTKQKWGDLPLATRIIDTEGEAGQAVEWAIIGVLFKEMKLRYSVLDQFVGTSTAIAAKDTEKVICSDSDTLLLEDASGRVALGGPLVDSELNNLVSGVMVACRGCVDRGGVLQVTDMITYGDGYTNKPPGSSSSWSAVLGPRSNSSNSSNSMEVDASEDTQEAEDDAYVMLVSGLEVGGRRSQEEMQANGESGDVDLARQMLLDYLSGRLGGEEEVKKSSRIARLVVAGNSIDIPPIDAEAVATSYGPARTKIEKDYQAKSTEIIGQFDRYLTQGLGCLDIDVMPGASDPTVQVFPQQPIHPCLLPQSSRFSSLGLVTNPHYCSLKSEGQEECRILGHSGQPLQDVLMQTNFSKGDKDKDKVDGRENMDMDMKEGAEKKEEKEKEQAPTVSERDPLLCLEALKRCYSWGHLAPTSPDTLPCYPLTHGDPFIIPSNHSNAKSNNGEGAPHIVFAGNCATYASELVRGEEVDGQITYATRLVCVPSFAKTGMAVLVNLRTLHASTINFQIGADADEDEDMDL